MLSPPGWAASTGCCFNAGNAFRGTSTKIHSTNLWLLTPSEPNAPLFSHGHGGVTLRPRGGPCRAWAGAAPGPTSGSHLSCRASRVPAKFPTRDSSSQTWLQVRIMQVPRPTKPGSLEWGPGSRNSKAKSGTPGSGGLRHPGHLNLSMAPKSDTVPVFRKLFLIETEKQTDRHADKKINQIEFSQCN